MWKYRRLIPKKFQKASGIHVFRFRVLDPWHRPYEYLATGPDTARRISPSALCSMLIDGKLHHVLVALNRSPALAEAVLLMGKVLFVSNRVEKYMTAYKAYECLAPVPDPTLSAVRHGLSHAGAALSRPSTVRSLEEIFGTTRIDLDRYPHQRQFYIQLGYLLQAVDGVLFNALSETWQDVVVIPSRDLALLDWEITGAWGERSPYRLVGEGA